MKLVSKLIAAVALTVVALTSQATIVIGDTVNVTHYYPDLSSSTDLGDQVVPTGSFKYFDLYEVTVSDTYMTLNAFCGASCSFDTADFNGAVLWDLTNALFTGVSIDASSDYVGFDASRLSFDADHVYINMQGLDANGFLRINFDGDTVGITVPEPESLTLVGLALAGLVLTRRKAKQA